MEYSIAGIVYENGKVLIGKRINKGAMAERWEFPGGKVEKGESFEQAIHREFFEELGIKISIGKEIAQAAFNHNEEKRELHAFFVSIPKNSQFTLCEHTETKWIEFSKIPTLSFVDSDLLILEQVRNACEQ